MMKNVFSLSRRSQVCRVRQILKNVPSSKPRHNDDGHADHTEEPTDHSTDSTTTTAPSPSPLPLLRPVQACSPEKESTKIRSRARNFRQSIVRTVSLRNFRLKLKSQQKNKPRKVVVRFDERRNNEIEPTHHNVPASDRWYTPAEIESFDTEEACFDGSYVAVTQRMNKFTMALSRIYGDCCQTNNTAAAIPQLVEELAQLYLDFPCSDYWMGLETQLIPGFAMQNQERRDYILFAMQQQQRGATTTTTGPAGSKSSFRVNPAPALFAQVLAQAQARANL